MQAESPSISTRISTALLFVLGAAMVIGVLQFAGSPFSNDGDVYSATLREGFRN